MDQSALNYNHTTHSNVWAICYLFLKLSIFWLRQIRLSNHHSQYKSKMCHFFIFILLICPFWMACRHRSKFAYQSVTMHTSKYILELCDIDTWVGYLTRFHNILLSQAHIPFFVFTKQKVAVFVLKQLILKTGSYLDTTENQYIHYQSFIV